MDERAIPLPRGWFPVALATARLSDEELHQPDWTDFQEQLLLTQGERVEAPWHFLGSTRSAPPDCRLNRNR